MSLKKALIGTLFPALLLSGCKTPQEVVEVGKVAPPIAAFDSQQQPIDLASFQGKPLILEFWTKECGACIVMMKAMNKLQAARGGEFNILAVNIDSQEIDIDAFAKKWQVKFPLVRDQLGISKERYAVAATPMTFFIDANGVVQHSELGFSPRMDLNNELNQLLQSQ